MGKEPREVWQSPRNVERGLGSHHTYNLGAFSPAQNRAILVAGVTCASISLLAVLSALRWFLLMRRSFRHHLILFLIFSDTFKSMCYFVFPIVVFTRGNVKSSSDFCQATGFLLSFGLEASDYAILMIALHALLHIFRPLRSAGQGGIYPYRRWLYVFWVIIPALAASLAFVNPGLAYVTSGTFCYLPQRPFWYRLALSWIPRYLVFIAILTMYAAIYLYVHIKFKTFKNLATGDSGYGSHSEYRHQLIMDSAAQNKGKNVDDALPVEFLCHRGHSGGLSDSSQGRGLPSPKRSSKTSHFSRSKNSRLLSTSPSKLHRREREPWEEVSFITAVALEDTGSPNSHGVPVANFVPEPSSLSADTRVSSQISLGIEQDPLQQDGRKVSEVLTVGTDFTDETSTTHISFQEAISQPTPTVNTTGTTDQLNMTRIAIRRQLRFLFIYPAVYLLMWTFPLAAHCLNYSDYYVAHPPFWLSVVTTCMLSLQAGADCVVFSWREKPWRRADKKSSLSTDTVLTSIKCCFSGKSSDDAVDSTVLPERAPDTKGTKGDANWWEAEGKKRKDSVWLGTDELNQIISRQQASEHENHLGG